MPSDAKNPSSGRGPGEARAPGAAGDRPPPDKIDIGLVSLLILAGFYGVPADGAQLRHLFGQSTKPFGDADLLRAATHLGFKAGLVDSEWSRLSVIQLPAIARRKDGRYLVLAKADDEKVLVQDPGEQRPQVLARVAFEEAWSGQLILITKRAGLRPEDRKFDFTWFIPAIVKYRKHLSEVLLASFFIQLFALLTPLFTQVVIDKVLVHKGMTTLHVLAIGMLALTLFDVVLGGLRTYVFSHTTSRIDVGLGAQLFRHLLTLPLAYFEARRVGDSVARVRELSTIRQFLTGSAVTVVIDLFFAVVFLAVMMFYSPLLPPPVGGAIPFYIGLSVLVTPIFRARLNEKIHRGAGNQSFLVESVTGIQTLKAMAIEPQMQRKWEEQLAGYVQASFRATTLGNTANQIASFISKVTTIAIIWLGAQLVIDNQLSIGQLIAFTMLAAQVNQPVLRIVQLRQEVTSTGGCAQGPGDS